MSRGDELSDELKFWDFALSQNRDDLKQRMEIGRWKEACPPLVIDLVQAMTQGGRRPLVLDVGCGPLSQIAYVQTMGAVLLGMDELADAYKVLLAKKNLHPNCMMLQVAIDEALGEPWPFMSKADLVWMRNALDHVYAPGIAMTNLVNLLAPGGVLVVSGFLNEGKHQNYLGLHQIDIFVADNRLWYQRHGSEPVAFDLTDLDVELKSAAEIRWFQAIIRRGLA